MAQRDANQANETKSEVDVTEQNRPKKRVRIEEKAIREQKDEEQVPSKSGDVYEQFDQALMSKEWLNTRFHDRLYKTYVRKVLHMEKTEFLETIKEVKSKGLRVQDVDRYVGRCGLCDKVRTKTKRIEVGDSIVIYCGKNCAEKFVNMMDFYIKMETLREENRRYREMMTHNVLDFWEKMISQTNEE